MERVRVRFVAGGWRYIPPDDTAPPRSRPSGLRRFLPWHWPQTRPLRRRTADDLHRLW